MVAMTIAKTVFILRSYYGTAWFWRRMEKKRMLVNFVVMLFLTAFAYGQQRSDAMRLLERVSQIYRSLDSYEIKAVMIQDEQWGEARDLSEIPLIMAGDKSGKFRIESKHPLAGGAQVSDGKTTWQYTAMRHQYTKKPVAPDASVPAPFLPTDYVNRYRHLAEKATEARLLRQETLLFEGKGVLCQVLEVQFMPGAEAKQSSDAPHTFWIAKKTALVLQEVWESRMDMMGAEGKIRTEIAYKSIRINQPIDDALFTFIPPPNAKEVETLSTPQASSRPLQNKPAPEFSLPTVEGKNASLSDFKGKTVLLDFWATWCLPCRESTPLIEKLHSAFSEKGLVILAVDSGEELEVVKGYLAHNPSILPNLVDSRNTVAKLYNVDSFPAFVVISKDGKLTYSSSGFSPDTEAQLRAVLKQEGIQ